MSIGKFTCSYCGKTYYSSKSLPYKCFLCGKSICEECWNKGIFYCKVHEPKEPLRCEYCGTLLNKDNIIVMGGEIMCKDCANLREDKNLLKEKIKKMVYESEDNLVYTEEIAQKYDLSKSYIKEIFKEISEEYKEEFVFVDIPRFTGMNEYVLAKKEYEFPFEKSTSFFKSLFGKSAKDEIPESLKKIVKSTNKREALEEAYAKKVAHIVQKIKFNKELNSLKLKEAQLVDKLKREEAGPIKYQLAKEIKNIRGKTSRINSSIINIEENIEVIERAIDTCLGTISEGNIIDAAKAIYKEKEKKYIKEEERKILMQEVMGMERDREEESMKELENIINEVKGIGASEEKSMDREKESGKKSIPKEKEGEDGAF